MYYGRLHFALINPQTVMVIIKRKTCLSMGLTKSVYLKQYGVRNILLDHTLYLKVNFDINQINSCVCPFR